MPEGSTKPQEPKRTEGVRDLASLVTLDSSKSLSFRTKLE